LEGGAPLLKIVVVETQGSNERCAIGEDTGKQKAKASVRQESEVVEANLSPLRKVGFGVY